MDSSTFLEVVLYILIATLSGLGIKLGQWVSELLLKRWHLSRTASSTKRDKPQRKRQRRQSAYRVLKLSRLELSQERDRYIATRGLVPLETRNRESRVRAAWNAVTDFLFTTRITSKPGFRILGWQCDPNPVSAAITGSFVLAIRLHPNENRLHLNASLQPNSLSTDRPRRVAIASISDLFDEESPVRCYVVDTFTTNLDNEDHEMIGVQSCNGASDGLPVCSARTVRNVPDDALWLITDNPAHTAPGETWGSSAQEIYETQDDPHDPPEPDDAETRRELEDDHRYISRTVRRATLYKVYLWLLVGPGVVLAGIVLLVLSRSMNSVTTSILAVWATIWIAGLFVYSGVLAGVLWQKWSWRRRDNQKRDGDRVWRGGTTDCLLLGAMVQKGRVLDKNEWERFWRKLRPEN